MRVWIQLAYLYLVDHGFLRAAFANRYKLPGGLYRSSQPSPVQLRRYKARYGIKSVVNLRGRNQDNPVWQLEVDICKNLNIKLYDVRLLSRTFPHVEDVLCVIEIIKSIEYPALVHCKSGADRAGLFSVLYRHVRLGESMNESIRELSPKYGHFKLARTGMIDSFFQEYIRYNNEKSISFVDWLTAVYDRIPLKENYDSRSTLSRIFDFLIDRILMRE